MSGVADHSVRGHARLSPSGSHRWINCPGSVTEEMGLPDASSVFAMHGTAAHELAELCGVQKVDPHKAIGHKIVVQTETFDVDREMAEAVELYIQTVTEGLQPDEILHWERRYPLPFLPGDTFGTADATRYDPRTKTMSVYDLKYGQGVAVEAIENTQGLCYAGGALYELNAPVEHVEVVIVQPRAWHHEGPVRRWKMGVAEFSERIADIKDAAIRALDPNAPRVPGEWCRFCKAQATCATLSAFALAEAQMVFGENPVTPEQLTPEQLGSLAEKAAIIRAWASAVEKHVHWMLDTGKEVPGWKLVNKRPRRQWVDPVASADFLMNKHGLSRDEVYLTEIVSPAAAEKLIPSSAKKELKPMTVSVSSGTTIAPLSDRRPPAAPGSTQTGDYRSVFTAIETD
jgi:hypothetical protein